MSRGLGDVYKRQQYYDSNASRLHNNSTGFEILLLMELCPNGSLLDYMNQRLATKLSEQEVLKIMYDITLALSHMHYLTEPLLHRDIKIENVLVDSDDNFKLCDFGSTSKSFHVVTTHQEIAMLTQNIYVHTTPQYRSPEMIDLYRYLPVNEKSDIWALGVLLYKLLFFTTPFEMTGQFAILHSKYEIPQNKFSSKLNNLIIIMLSENPNLRPNIYQVLYQICSITGITVPINDIYEAGPYNFENYTHFQNKIQNMQFQMFEIEKKRVENRGRLGPAENKILNNIFMSSFDIASKISFPTGEVTSLSQATVSKEQSFPKDNSQDKLTSGTPDTIAQNSVHSQEIVPLDETGDIFKDAMNGTQGVRNKLNEMVLNDEGSYYPSVGELNQFIDNDVAQVQNNNLEDIAKLRFPDINQTPVTNRPEILDAKTSASSNKLFKPIPQDSLVTDNIIRSENTTNIYTQHKSTNPFPKISNDTNNQQMKNKNDFGNVPNPISINSQQLPRGYPNIQTPVDSINYLNNQQKKVETLPGQQSSNTTPFNLNEPQQSRPVTQLPPSGSPINGNVDYNAASNSQEQFKMAYNQFKGLAEVDITQGSPTANIQQAVNSPMVTRVQSQKQQQQVPPIPDTSSPVPPVLPTNRPRNHQPDQNDILKKNTSSDESLPPKVPPHPRKKSEETQALKDVENLRDPKTGKLKIEQVDVNVGGRHSHHHSQHSRSHRNSGHDNLGVRRSVSMSNKPKMLLERPTTETIDIDLDKLKRKSLDLKMQKSGFVSNLKDQSIQENEVSGHQQNAGSSLNRQRLSKRNVSNGSISNSTSNTDEIKKSITRARQSLDLDRARRDALLAGDNNKRRSLFSMFRADKK